MEKKCINEELIINHFVRQIKIGKVWGVDMEGTNRDLFKYINRMGVQKGNP